MSRLKIEVLSCWISKKIDEKEHNIYKAEKN